MSCSHCIGINSQATEGGDECEFSEVSKMGTCHVWRQLQQHSILLAVIILLWQLIGEEQKWCFKALEHGDDFWERSRWQPQPHGGLVFTRTASILTRAHVVVLIDEWGVANLYFIVDKPFWRRQWHGSPRTKLSKLLMAAALTCDVCFGPILHLSLTCEKCSRVFDRSPQKHCHPVKNEKTREKVVKCAAIQFVGSD